MISLRIFKGNLKIYISEYWLSHKVQIIIIETEITVIYVITIAVIDSCGES